MIAAMAAMVLGLGGTLKASAFFDFVGNSQQPPGSIFYNPPSGSPNGDNILVNEFTNISEIRNRNDLSDSFSINGGFLFYSTGIVIPPSGPSSQVQFDPGGAFSIYGGIAGLGIPDGSKLFEGVFNTPVTVSVSADGLLGTVGGSVAASFINPAIQAHFAPGQAITGTVLAATDTFDRRPADPNNPFQSGFVGGQNVGAVSISTPEPSTFLIWMSGLVGMSGLKLRKRLSQA